MVVKITGIKNCGFQYYDGYKIVVDKVQLSLQEAKDLWNKWYKDCVDKLEYERNVEMVIWVNMKDPNSYNEKLDYIDCDCIVIDGTIYKPISKKL